MTFQEASDKIIQAYFRDEVTPYSECACFIGNLLNRTRSWGCRRTINRESSQYIPMRESGNILDDVFGFYTVQELCDLETVFMNEIWLGCEGGDLYEEMIFRAMSKALDKLRKIHEAKGEIVDMPVLQKRQLSAV